MNLTFEEFSFLNRVTIRVSTKDIYDSLPKRQDLPKVIRPVYPLNRGGSPATAPNDSSGRQMAPETFPVSTVCQPVGVTESNPGVYKRRSGNLWL